MWKLPAKAQTMLITDIRPIVIAGAGHAADPFGQPAEEQRADHLAQIAGGDQQADLAGRDVPQPDQHRQHEGQRQGVEGVEEGGGAHDDARPGVPAANVDVFDSEQQAGLARVPGDAGGGGVQGLFVAIPSGMMRCSCCLRYHAVVPPSAQRWSISG